MKPIASFTAVLAIAALPALAQTPTPTPDDTPRNPDLSEGAQLLSDGMKLLLKGLMTEGTEGWEKLVDWLDDISLYEPPERLPNGDIVIRRKVPLEPGEIGTDL
jgi:hypothetical protein